MGLSRTAAAAGGRGLPALREPMAAPPRPGAFARPWSEIGSSLLY